MQEIIFRIKDKCPEGIIPEEQKTCPDSSDIQIFRFIRLKYRKQDTYPYFMNYDLFKKRLRESSLKHMEQKACIMCGLSVFQSLRALMNILKKKFRNQKALIVKATFKPQDGTLYKTGALGHYTFFPFSPFDHDEYFAKDGCWNKGQYEPA